ncbi:hypothetical protein H310_07696 [Aphanomyces invadans]|uniref:U2A'/phosphoprotein 32 family A C-terminal domain-containing protein n=1 Tax=Aphanomyces invadans TaxID=157072 RepID=A0A024U1M8_9STRA|nr:hypothetical protein H310_07696 [Aphanomyces invadans]ETW00326.1 hypothetical protein H310_07696 [Aphanomyces invadans]|eukprot:XP_008871351.1 hypothetical protein H310_07696 [Aphanomyces invadans]
MSKESTSTNGGVHVTTEMLMHASKTTLAKGESTEHYLHRITHLTLNNKKLTSMTNLHRCTNVKVVLYMYDNKIASIDATLSSLRHLTHVHLQRNRISKIEHFDALVHLEKLYLDGNQISRLEGLANCTSLQELHLSNQVAAPSSGDEFTFDEDSIMTLRHSLRILHAANCNIRNPAPIQALGRLELLDLSRNHIRGVDAVYGLVGNLRRLKDLNLTNNHVNATPKYRDNTIIFSHASLAVLDTKPIDANQRATMQSHMAFKHKKRLATASSIKTKIDAFQVHGSNTWVGGSPNQDQ